MHICTLVFFLFSQLVGLYLLMYRNQPWGFLVLLVSMFVLIVSVIKGCRQDYTLYGLMVSLVVSLLYSIGYGISRWIAVLRHIGLVVVCLLLYRNRSMMLYHTIFTFTWRVSVGFTLMMTVASISFVSRHYNVQQIDCEDINTIVAQQSITIDGLLDRTAGLPRIQLSTNPPLWQTIAFSSRDQLLDTWEEKQAIDDQLCSLFVTSIHHIASQKNIQSGGLILLAVILYTIFFVPILFLSVIYALLLWILILCGVIHVKTRETTQTMLS